MRYLVTSITLLLVLLCASGFTQSLSQLLEENNRIKLLEQYKDSPQELKWKLANLEVINRSRRAAGSSPVRLNILASRIANQHCQDMIHYDYMGHWDSKGRKPYQRYANYGGTDHVAENLYMLQSFRRVGKRQYENSLDTGDLLGYMNKGHQSFMAERPPHDGHRQEVLSPFHTHVGIGYALSGGEFRYAQEFLDRYLDLDSFDMEIQQGDTLTITGRTIDPDYGVYGALVYEDEMVKSSSFLKNQPNSYPDFGKTLYTKIPPWNTQYNRKTRQFSIPVSFKKARRGVYYLLIYVKPNPNAIPYDPKGNAEWSTKNGIPAAGIVIQVK